MNLDKLNIKNWYIWNPRFLRIMKTWPEAAAHLNAEYKNDTNKYDAILDNRLVVVVDGACQTTGINSINFVITRPMDSPSWTLNSLYSHLKQTLLEIDRLSKPELLPQTSDTCMMKSELLCQVRAIRMVNSDVRKLVISIALGQDRLHELRTRGGSSQQRQVWCRPRVGPHYPFSRPDRVLCDTGGCQRHH